MTIQCDASKSAVGSVLMQEVRLTAYASRKRRVSIRAQQGGHKEGNAGNRVQYAEIQVQTDHKPLEMILRKPMTTSPLRLQAMMLKVSGKSSQTPSAVQV